MELSAIRALVDECSEEELAFMMDGQQAQPCMIESSSDSGSEKIPVLDAVVAAELTPGEHEIVIEYRSTELLIGTAISLAGVMALVAIICIEKRRKGRSSKEG